jgi:hypothetical protein
VSVLLQVAHAISEQHFNMHNTIFQICATYQHGAQKTQFVPVALKKYGFYVNCHCQYSIKNNISHSSVIYIYTLIYLFIHTHYIYTYVFYYFGRTHNPPKCLYFLVGNNMLDSQLIWTVDCNLTSHVLRGSSKLQTKL